MVILNYQQFYLHFQVKSMSCDNKTVQRFTPISNGKTSKKAIDSTIRKCLDCVSKVNNCTSKLPKLLPPKVAPSKITM